MFGNPIHIKTYPTDDLTKIHLVTTWGDIQCLASDNGEIKIEVFAQKLSFSNPFQWQNMSQEEFKREQFRIVKRDNTLNIHSQINNESNLLSLLRFRRVSFRVHLPKDFSTDLKTYKGKIYLDGLSGINFLNTRLGKIEIRNLHGKTLGTGKSFGYPIVVNNCHGEIKLSTSGGTIEIYRSSGNQEYNTSGGRITIADFDGNLKVKTSGGSIRADRIDGELRAASLGGSIKVFGASGNVAANTKGGSVKVDMDHISEFLWLETSGGSIDFTFPENLGMEITAKGSRVRSYGQFHFEGAKRRGKWDGKVNQGGPNVQLKTGGGGVRIRTKPIIQRTAKNPIPKTSYQKTASEVKQERPIASQQTISNKFANKKVNIPVPNFESRAQAKGFKDKASLTAIDRIPVFMQILSAFAFTILFVYGLNSITYFTSELFNPTSLEAEQNKAVALLNLTTGLSAFLGVTLFIYFIEKYIRPKWSKYFVLIGVTSLMFFIIHIIINNTFAVQDNPNDFWKYFTQITRPKDYFFSNNFSVVFYSVIPSFVACAYFAYWRNSTNLNRKISEQEYQLLNLDKLKTKAQLTALEARINPHFLYNSLNSIAGLIHEDQDKAEDMTVELSKLFRATTGRNNESNHTIEEEINLVKSYLAIEQMRFGDRLTYQINVDDSLNQIKIPRFLLQPLVENAIKHGISKIATNGMIKIDIKKVAHQIQIDIHDNGPDFGESVSGGYGLKSVRDKLKLIYGEKASFYITNTPVKNIEISIDRDYEL
ncbi:MAG: two-component system LytT family sensor kinase [Arcticibacterium sp.]|jgi:two-component system LytT family sensor kinase